MKIKKLFNTPTKASLTIASLIAITATLGTGTVYGASAIAKNSSISAESAKNFSFADAGIDPTTAKAVQTEFGYEHGQFVYEVEFIVDNTEYEYLMKASDGTVVKKEIETVDTIGKKDNETVKFDGKNDIDTVKLDGKNDIETVKLDGKNEVTSTQISLEKAKEIALSDAKLTENTVTFTTTKLDKEDNISVYEVEFYSDNVEYEYEINASDGTIYSKSKEIENEQKAVTSIVQQPTQSETSKNKTHSKNNVDGSDKETSSSYIGIDKAKAIASSHAGLTISEVTFSKAKLDTDDGNTTYEIEFYKDGLEYEYEVDASSGNILEYETEQAD